MLKKKIIIFTNNERSIEIIKNLKKKFKVKLIVTIKKIDKDLLNKINKFKIPILFLEDSYKKLYNNIRLINPDFIICAGFTRLIPKGILELASFSAINLHGGKVPRYLGASTLNWQIINNENFIYISALKMNSIIDGGPLIAEKKIRIKKDEYIDDVKKRINLLFPKLCITAINNQIKGLKMKYFPMSEKIYWRQRSKKDSEIDVINSNYLEIFNKIRASSSKNYPAFIKIKNKKYFLNKVKLINYKSTYTNKKILVRKNKIIINFKNKHLLIQILQD